MTTNVHDIERIVVITSQMKWKIAPTNPNTIEALCYDEPGVAALCGCVFGRISFRVV